MRHHLDIAGVFQKGQRPSTSGSSRAAWAPVTIRPALLGPDAAVIGAALTSIDQIRQRPIAWLAQQQERSDRVRS